MLYFSRVIFKHDPNGMSFDILVPDWGHLMYYIPLKPHEN